MTRKLLITLLFVAAPAGAAPFLLADTVAGVQSCGYGIDGSARVYFPVVTVLGVPTCLVDLSGTGTGAHTVTLTARAIDDVVWGTQESPPSSPFTLTRPGIPSSPIGLRLSATQPAALTGAAKPTFVGK